MEVNIKKDMGFWQKAKAFHGTGWGKAAIYGTAAGLALKIGWGYGLYKAGQASVNKKTSGGTKHKTTHLSPGGKYDYKITSYKKQPKKYMAG